MLRHAPVFALLLSGVASAFLAGCASASDATSEDALTAIPDKHLVFDTGPSTTQGVPSGPLRDTILEGGELAPGHVVAIAYTWQRAVELTLHDVRAAGETSYAAPVRTTLGYVLTVDGKALPEVGLAPSTAAPLTAGNHGWAGTFTVPPGSHAIGIAFHVRVDRVEFASTHVLTDVLDASTPYVFTLAH